MEQFAIDDLNRQVVRLRELLAEEPSAENHEHMRYVADAIEAKLLEAARGGQDVGGK